MTSRSFIVFQDAPEAPKSTITLARKVASGTSTSRGVLGVRSGSQVNIISASDNKPSVVDKENYNPLTGERSSLVTGTEKKRKTVVLAAKAVPPKSGRKALKNRAPLEPQPESKKRKTATTTKKTKVTSENKEGKLSSKAMTSRKPKRSSPSRRVASLPRVEEETGLTATPAEGTSNNAQSPNQAEIDSRCYELTVQPLADVSSAYGAVPSLAVGESSPKGPLRMIKEPSVEPELRDYFSPSHSSLFSSSHSREASQQTLFNDDDVIATQSTVTTFSTPERQKIYSAFTFCSPSPSSKRFRQFGARSVSPTPFIIDGTVSDGPC